MIDSSAQRLEAHSLKPFGYAQDKAVPLEFFRQLLSSPLEFLGLLLDTTERCLGVTAETKRPCRQSFFSRAFSFGPCCC